MAEFLSDLAAKAGLDSDQAHQGIGALLAMLKSRLDPATFAHVQKAIPNSDEMVAGYEDKKQWAGSGGGLLDAVKGMAGKLLGSNSDKTAALESHFASIGLTPDHIKSLLPKLHDALASKLPPQVLDQLKQHVPGFGPAVEQEANQE